jgi:hypothetical protein
MSQEQEVAFLNQLYDRSPRRHEVYEDPWQEPERLAAREAVKWSIWLVLGAATWVGLAYGLLWLALNGHDYLDKLIKGWLG